VQPTAELGRFSQAPFAFARRCRASIALSDNAEVEKRGSRLFLDRDELEQIALGHLVGRHIAAGRKGHIELARVSARPRNYRQRDAAAGRQFLMPTIVGLQLLA
jgi:hypothetical protein